MDKIFEAMKQLWQGVFSSIVLFSLIGHFSKRGELIYPIHQIVHQGSVQIAGTAHPV
jgi:hypothetical protein